MTPEAVTEAVTAAIAAARDAGADDVECSYDGGEVAFHRYARSRFTQVGAVTTGTLRVRALVGNRLGAQLTGTLDADAVRATARGAVDAARNAPALDVKLAFAAPGGDASDAPAAPTAREIPEAFTSAGAPATLARAFAVAAKQSMHCAGALKIVRRSRAVRTAAGVDRRADEQWIVVQLIAADGDASGFAGATTDFDAPPDVAALATAAADRAARSRDAARVDARPYDVVLAPTAVAELVEWMSMASFGADAVLDGQSLLAGRTGATVCSPRVTIADRAGAGEIRFDAEGSPRRDVVLIDAGAAGVPVTDRITALRLGDTRGSTGHARPIADDYGGGPTPVHLWMSAGDASEAELIASVDDGLYVTRLHYVNGLLDTRRAVTTGMTRDGTFRIQGGKLTTGVRNLRFTDAMVDAFGDRLGGIGSATHDVPTWWSANGRLTVPAVLVRGFRFTGQSR